MRRNQLDTLGFAVHNEQKTAASLKEGGHTERVQKLLDEMHSEFGRRRKIQILGLPPDFAEKVVNAGSSCYNSSVVFISIEVETNANIIEQDYAVTLSISNLRPSLLIIKLCSVHNKGLQKLV